MGIMIGNINENLSMYSRLYDLIINKNHPLRKFNELDDFSYAMEELTEKYCLDNGRHSHNPIMMFNIYS